MWGLSILSRNTDALVAKIAAAIEANQGSVMLCASWRVRHLSHVSRSRSLASLCGVGSDLWLQSVFYRGIIILVNLLLVGVFQCFVVVVVVFWGVSDVWLNCICWGVRLLAALCVLGSQTFHCAVVGTVRLQIFCVQDCQTSGYSLFRTVRLRYSVFRTVRLLDILHSGLSDLWIFRVLDCQISGCSLLWAIRPFAFSLFWRCQTFEYLVFWAVKPLGFLCLGLSNLWVFSSLGSQTFGFSVFGAVRSLDVQHFGQSDLWVFCVCGCQIFGRLGVQCFGQSNRCVFCLGFRPLGIQ